MSTIVPNVLEHCTQHCAQLSQTLSTFYKTHSFPVCSVVKILLLSARNYFSVLIFPFVVQSDARARRTLCTSDTPHYEQVPEGWCITNIGDLLINRDGERKPVSSAIRSKQVNKIYDYYGAAGVIDKVDDYIFDERLLLIGEDGANLLSRTKDNAFFAEGKYWVNNHAHVLDATDKFILDYVAIVINAMKLDEYVTGSAQPKLSQDNLNKIPIYLPPLEEQKRILVEINRLFDLIYKLELGKADLATIVKQAKTKILDLAIHGKLVPQNHNDEPASELLKRINPKAELTCDNGHYQNLPTAWAMCKLSDLCKIENGFAFSSNDYKTEGTPLVRISNIVNNSIDLTECVYIQNKTDDRFIVARGDLLIAMSGATTGKMGVYSYEGTSYLNQRVGNIKILDNSLLLTGYRDVYMQSKVDDILKLAYGGAQPNISASVIGNFDFLLPPVDEQKRIIEAINFAFEYLDIIIESL